MHPSAPEPIGWPLLPLPDAHGRLLWPDLASSIRQRIQALLATRPGEQLRRPGLGAGLDAFLHQPNTLATRRAMAEAVERTLSRWEPRIVLDAVQVLEQPGQPTQLRVLVHYRIARNGAPAQLAALIDLAG